MNKNKVTPLEEVTIIEWVDSYGAMSGWISLDDYKPEQLVCISSGIKVYDDEKVVALAPNYANATTYTPKQANGLMVIPKSSIIRTTSFSCLLSASEQKQQHFSRL